MHVRRSLVGKHVRSATDGGSILILMAMELIKLGCDVVTFTSEEDYAAVTEDEMDEVE